MHGHDIAEQAYKRGYEDGKKAATGNNVSHKKTIADLLHDVCATGRWNYGVDMKTGEHGGHDMTPEDIAEYLVENSVTVQQWISVKDRLPEETGRVLVRTASGYIGTETYIKGKMFSSCGVWIPVTHWMPLPEPPKG